MKSGKIESPEKEWGGEVFLSTRGGGHRDRLFTIARFDLVLNEASLSDALARFSFLSFVRKHVPFGKAF